MADIQWFCDARFGMFIHWGLYAVPAKGEWYASIGRVPPERYEEYLRTFDPVYYDPRAWARMEARPVATGSGVMASSATSR